MQTAHDQWLEAPYQDAEEAAARRDATVERSLADHGWLADRMQLAAELVADELAETICDKAVWTDADALLMGRILMDELIRLAYVEVRP